MFPCNFSAFRSSHASPPLRPQQRVWLWSLTAVMALAAAASDAAEQRGFIAADSSRKLLAIVNEDGTTAWSHPIGPLHDLHVLPGGTILFQDTWTHVLEVDRQNGRVVWEYEARTAPGNQDQRVEIHAFQRLENGHTLIAESGRSRLIELTPDNKIVTEVRLQVSRSDAHRDTRLVRRLTSGNYLVCHEGDAVVREYAADGRVVWEYKIPLFGRQPAAGHGVEAYGNQCFSALRLPNGNTLIGTGNGHSVIEVTPAGQVVWSLHQNELPGIQLAWVTSLQLLPNGNILINNCHAGPENPQLIEVSRDKRVVWSFCDFERFGDSLTNSQILTINGQAVSSVVPGHHR